MRNIFAIDMQWYATNISISWIVVLLQDPEESCLKPPETSPSPKFLTPCEVSIYQKSSKAPLATNEDFKSSLIIKKSKRAMFTRKMRDTLLGIAMTLLSLFAITMRELHLRNHRIMEPATTSVGTNTWEIVVRHN